MMNEGCRSNLDNLLVDLKENTKISANLFFWGGGDFLCFISKAESSDLNYKVFVPTIDTDFSILYGLHNNTNENKNCFALYFFYHFILGLQMKTFERNFFSYNLVVTQDIYMYRLMPTGQEKIFPYMRKHNTTTTRKIIH